jgi:hypothetical protein
MRRMECAASKGVKVQALAPHQLGLTAVVSQPEMDNDQV